MTPEEAKEAKNKIEAILFSAGRAVPLDELCKICNLSPTIVKEAVKELKHDIEQRDSPLLLAEELNAWKLTVREKYLDLVRNIIPHMELDKATLETLAVIAWKQPVMQAEVIKIRTSAAYEHINHLVEMGFIAKEKKGRSFVLKTTGRFFDYFDLPGKEALKDMLKHIEEGLQATGQRENLTGKKLGPLDIYTTKEGEHSQTTATAALPSEETTEHIGKLEVYEKPETEPGAEPSEESGDVFSQEPAEEYEEEQEGEPQETEEEKGHRVIQELAKEDEEEAPQERAEKPEKKLHPALERFIEDEEETKEKEEDKE